MSFCRQFFLWSYPGQLAESLLTPPDPLTSKLECFRLCKTTFLFYLQVLLYLTSFKQRSNSELIHQSIWIVCGGNLNQFYLPNNFDLRQQCEHAPACTYCKDSSRDDNCFDFQIFGTKDSLGYHWLYTWFEKTTKWMFLGKKFVKN